MPSGGTIAALVTGEQKDQSATTMQFADPHDALTWAIKNKAGFVFFNGAMPKWN